MNQLTLALLLCVTIGFLFSLSARATDHFGTDCQDVIISGFGQMNCQSIPEDFEYNYYGQACQKSPSGKCCQYDAYNVRCPSDHHLIYNEYELSGAGQSGKTCIDGTCQ